MNPIAAIHVAKKQLGLDDDSYREVLFAVAGKRSARDLSPGERGRVLDEFRRLGFAPTPAKRRAPSARGALDLDGPYAGKLRALWISGWNLGVVHDRSDKALLAFVERQTGLSHTRFLRDAADARKAIEALKAWLAREASVEWPAKAPLPGATKRAVIAAQYRLLGHDAAGAQARAEIAGDPDALIAELGHSVRALKEPRR